MPVILPPLKWQPTPNFSSRHGQRIDLLVWHETAGHYLSDIAWLCNPISEVSAHLVVREDGLEATQLVKRADKAWTQGQFNSRSIGIEHSNVTAKGFSTEYQLRVSARIFGWLCLQHAIPPRWSRDGSGRGITRHLDLGAAGGGHTQCGPGLADWQRFLAMVGAEIQRGDYRTVWMR